jgi:hypothetical protein
VLPGAALLNERLPGGIFVGETCVLVAVVTRLVGERPQSILSRFARQT